MNPCFGLFTMRYNTDSGKESDYASGTDKA